MLIYYILFLEIDQNFDINPVRLLKFTRENENHKFKIYLYIHSSKITFESKKKSYTLTYSMSEICFN